MVPNLLVKDSEEVCLLTMRGYFLLETFSE